MRIEKPIPAEVESAVDLVKLRDEWERACGRENRAEKSLAEVRLEKGRILVEARKAFPARGPRAKGWGELLAKWKIDQPTAWRYMELAGYVAEEVSCNVNETVPTYAEAGITKPRSLSPDLNGKSYYDAAVETARFPHEWDDVKSLAEKPWAHDLIPDAATERPLFHQEAQRRLPPPVEEREDRTVRLRAFWDRVYVDAKKLDVHLTDATASVDDFHSTKNTLIAIANLVLEELERAGVLTAEGQQKQRLLILDGGKGK